MALLKFKAPTLPAPGDSYDKNYLNQLIRTLANYFNLLDSTTPIQVDSMILSGLPKNGNGLPIGAVYQQGDVLMIVVADKNYSPSFTVTTALGSVTVTTS